MNRDINSGRSCWLVEDGDVLAIGYSGHACNCVAGGCTFETTGGVATEVAGTDLAPPHVGLMPLCSAHREIFRSDQGWPASP